MKTMNSKMVSVLALAMGLFFGTTASALANETDTMSATAENKATVQFAGSTTESVFYDVAITNPKGDKLTLVVVNEDGEVVFLKNYDGKSNLEKIALSNTQEAKRYQFTLWSASATGDLKAVVIKKAS